MIESEAKEKWCPMVRFPAGNNMNVDATADGDKLTLTQKPAGKCIASSCMMWRVDEGGIRETFNTASFGGPDMIKYWAKGKGGYCGLAGKP